MTDSQVSLAAFVEAARGWLEANAEPAPQRADIRWGDGSDQVSLFDG